MRFPPDEARQGGQHGRPAHRLAHEATGGGAHRGGSAAIGEQGQGARGKADNYIKDGRVHCAVPAIYTDGSELDRVIKANINAVAARAALSGLFAEGPQ